MSEIWSKNGECSTDLQCWIFFHVVERSAICLKLSEYIKCTTYCVKAQFDT